MKSYSEISPPWIRQLGVQRFYRPPPVSDPVYNLTFKIRLTNKWSKLYNNLRPCYVRFRVTVKFNSNRHFFGGHKDNERSRLMNKTPIINFKNIVHYDKSWERLAKFEHSAKFRANSLDFTGALLHHANKNIKHVTCYTCIFVHVYEYDGDVIHAYLFMFMNMTGMLYMHICSCLWIWRGWGQVYFFTLCKTKVLTKYFNQNDFS